MVAGLAPCMGEGGHVPNFQSCLAAFGNAGRKGRTAGSGGGAANTAHTQGGGSDGIAAKPDGGVFVLICPRYIKLWCVHQQRT